MRNQHATPHNQAAKLNADERRLRTIELRKAGLSLRQIAGQTGVSVVTAKKDLDRALADLLAEQNARTEELRALELERLDKMFMSLWMKAYDDRGRAIDYGAIDRLLRIAERRAKLLGLDAPAKIAQTDAEGRTVAFNVMLSPPPTTPPDAPDSED